MMQSNLSLICQENGLNKFEQRLKKRKIKSMKNMRKQWPKTKSSNLLFEMKLKFDLMRNGFTSLCEKNSMRMLVETEDLFLMVIQEHLLMLKKSFWCERRNSSLMKKEIRYLILMMLKIQIVKMKNHQPLEKKRKRRIMIITKLIKLLSQVVLLD